MLEDRSFGMNLMSATIERKTTSTEPHHSSSHSDNGSTDGDEISSTVGSSSDHGNNGTDGMVEISSATTTRTSTERAHLRKCTFAGGCTKNAQGKTLMCIKHGGT